MEIRQLRHFCALIKYGSFTKAAEKLDIAQPALSQSLKRLEQTLGVTLVQRQARKHAGVIKLTAEGQVLKQHADLILQQVSQAESHIRQMADLSRGEVRVAVPGMLGSFYLPTRLMAFRHQYENLKLSLFEGGTRDALKMLEQHEVDIAIITKSDLKPEFDSCVLINEEIVVAAAFDHPLSEHTSVTMEQFFEHELVMFKPGYYHREWMLNRANALGLTPRIAFETNLINLIKQVVQQGFAVATLLKMVVQPKDNINTISLDPPVYVELHIAWKKHRPLSQADQAFVNFLLENR
ncbi:LysR family transcriptional regulator [Shewanella avicenniae]|uniref:LysR family transcriptional regulator n=1 Tax=Shewanella avicenniae TaxID=2814294 RepID=A0ABX7QM92_9GAMM|nr:LysR family transcriptional regulator [Shewanella avicenniae]QSX32567.1 LysR family transcriptional regulator [Shewanella avicenniae]